MSPTLHSCTDIASPRPETVTCKWIALGGKLMYLAGELQFYVVHGTQSIKTFEVYLLTDLGTFLHSS